jgi:hypothetical protein
MIAATLAVAPATGHPPSHYFDVRFAPLWYPVQPNPKGL